MLRKWFNRLFGRAQDLASKVASPQVRSASTRAVAAGRLSESSTSTGVATSKDRIFREDIHSVVNVGMKVEGPITVCRGLWVAGEVVGNITSLRSDSGKSLIIIGRSGSLTGDARAEVVVVYGKVNGNIYAEHIVAAESSVINGDIHYSRRMQAHDGASINGRFQHERPSAVPNTSTNVHELPLSNTAAAHMSEERRITAAV